MSTHSTTTPSIPRKPLRHKHLLGLEGWSRDDIVQVLDAAEALRPLTRATEALAPTLRGKTVINLFFEASTRTRTSFELAARRLGAEAVNISPAGSSVVKGESLLDTVMNVNAMRADAIVLRHQASGAAHHVAQALDAAGATCAVVNAGDGLHEHPTQALLDALTIRDHVKKRHDFSGLVVAISGDLAHSRVARSNGILLTTLGATVRFAGPRTLLPVAIEKLKPEGAPGTIEVFDRLEPAMEGADVVMMLRVQRERLLGAFISSAREYARTFGLTPDRLKLAKPGALVMHPGPINRGVEIDNRVADGDQSVILEQVENGLAVRMAVLHLLGGGVDSKAA